MAIWKHMHWRGRLELVNDGSTDKGTVISSQAVESFRRAREATKAENHSAATAVPYRAPWEYALSACSGWTVPAPHKGTGISHQAAANSNEPVDSVDALDRNVLIALLSESR